MEVNPYSHLSDGELMRLYQEGESMAFDVIYLRHKDKIYSYIARRVFDENSVNEIFQNAMLKFHRNRTRYDNSHPLLKWLYVITKSELLDFVKKKKIVIENFDEAKFSTDQSGHDTDCINLDEISSLNKNEKEAIALRYFSDHDFEEISQKLNLKESNVRKIISRGIKKIKLALSQEDN